MPSPIIARADALMQRRRSSGGETEEVPVLTDALDDDDIPVLFNVELPEFNPGLTPLDESLPPLELAIPEIPPISPQPAPDAPWVEQAPDSSAGPVRLLDAALALEALPASPPNEAGERIALANEVARRIEQRLVAALPQLIASTLQEVLAERDNTSI